MSSANIKPVKVDRTIKEPLHRPMLIFTTTTSCPPIPATLSPTPPHEPSKSQNNTSPLSGPQITERHIQEELQLNELQLQDRKLEELELAQYLAWSHELSSFTVDDAASITFNPEDFKAPDGFEESVSATDYDTGVPDDVRETIPSSRLIGTLLETVEGKAVATPEEPRKPYDVVPGTEISSVSWSLDLELMRLEEVVGDSSEKATKDDNVKSTSQTHDGIDVYGERKSDFDDIVILDNTKHDPTKYISVLPFILARAKDPCRLLENPNANLKEPNMRKERIELVMEIVREKIAQHRGASDMFLSLEEEKWLVEKLVWSGLCKLNPLFPRSHFDSVSHLVCQMLTMFALTVPKAKSFEFPGKRPANPEYIKNEIVAGDLKPCSICYSYGVDKQECPLMEVRKCPDHGEYAIRCECLIGGLGLL